MPDQEKLLIPKDLFEELEYAKDHPNININYIVEKILKNQMFQMLNPDYPIPHDYCLHLRQIVYPDLYRSPKDGTETFYKSYQCINCKKYL